jgi:CRISPR-associated endoribonuclease Cas6
MRLKLTLTVDRRLNTLPLNYQYPVSSWIYKTIHASNSDFSRWLHQQGYTLENKRFKLFTFSDIFIRPRWKRFGDRIAIYSGRSELQLSFYVDEAVEHFIIGLFQNQRFSLGDRRSKAGFEVQTVERLADPEFTPEMSFRTLSPICLSRTISDKNHAEYIYPHDSDYPVYFFDNLLYKYMAVTEEEISFETVKAEMQQRQPFTLEVLDDPVSRLIKIRADTPQETSVRGYFYRFKITAPVELLELGYHAGFGEKNSTGFGFCDLVPG